MCVVSMVHDYYKDRFEPWERPPRGWPDQLPTQPPLKPKESSPFDPEALRLLKEAIERLEALDKRLGDRECKDPDKTKWLEELEQRVKRLEGGK